MIDAPAQAADRAPWRAACECEIWCVDLGAAGPALAALECETPRLTAADRTYAASFTDPTLASERLAAYIALRLLIERAGGPQWRGKAVVRTPHGKPHLAGAEFGFSLSHVAGLALIGLARCGAIGVDLERTRTVHLGLERRRLIEAAAVALAADAPLAATEDARFLQAWVRLEALAKAQGAGIGRLLTRLGIVGARADGLAEVERRAREVVGAAPRMSLRGVALGEGLFAAAAAEAQMGPDLAVRWLPDSIAGLAGLVAEGQ